MLVNPNGYGLPKHGVGGLSMDKLTLNSINYVN